VQKTIVHIWLDLKMAEGKTKAAALRELNSALGTKHRQGRIYEWLSGKYSPERATRVYMLVEVLPTILEQQGYKRLGSKLTNKQLLALAESIA
jgi:hypothetical protein